jgi:hypothetical protein
MSLIAVDAALAVSSFSVVYAEHRERCLASRLRVRDGSQC